VGIHKVTELSRQKRRGVFLDRDGVINRAVVRDGKPHPPATVEELEILPDASSALSDLKNSGFLLLVITNQPDVGRGLQQREVVERMNQILASALPLDAVFVCYHTDDDACDCRKPRPGMLVRAAREWDLDLARSFMVGDRWRDIEAGHNAGCLTVLIDRNYQEIGPACQPDVRVKSLREAADWILRPAAQGGGL
jgi:D-glycero-D-manno-heptose 1,7-bisphosphate phosphatase